MKSQIGRPPGEKGRLSRQSFAGVGVLRNEGEGESFALGRREELTMAIRATKKFYVTKKKSFGGGQVTGKSEKEYPKTSPV